MFDLKLANLHLTVVRKQCEHSWAPPVFTYLENSGKSVIEQKCRKCGLFKTELQEGDLGRYERNY